MERFELGGGFGNLKGLVIGQAEIEAESAAPRSGGRTLQRRLVLIDRILVAAEFGQDGAQVGPRLDAVRLGRDAGLVFSNGARKISRLMQLDGAIQGHTGHAAACAISES